MSNTIDIYSTPEYRKVEAVVQLMVDGRLTSYRVATETNISKMSLATLTKGTSKIKNITYQTALALIDWSPFSAHTMLRSLRRSFNAIMPPVKPSRMENGPVMSRDAKVSRR